MSATNQARTLAMYWEQLQAEENIKRQILSQGHALWTIPNAAIITTTGAPGGPAAAHLISHNAVENLSTASTIKLSGHGCTEFLALVMLSKKIREALNAKLLGVKVGDRVVKDPEISVPVEAEGEKEEEEEGEPVEKDAEKEGQEVEASVVPDDEKRFL